MNLLIICRRKRKGYSCGNKRQVNLSRSCLSPASLFLAGERADFVLTADQPVSAYWLHAIPAEDCNSSVIKGAAILRYEGAPEGFEPISPTESGLELGSSSSTVSFILLQYLCLNTNKDRLCGLVVRIPGYRSRGPGFDSRRYQTFWEVVGLVRSPLSLVSTIEELYGRSSSGSGLESRGYGRWDPLRWPRDTL
jgi:hypothetical protein